MKNKLLISILLTILLATSTQGQLWQYTSDATRHSIVRSVDESRTLMLSQEAPGSARFILRDESLGEDLYVSLPPFWGLVVRDMRVDDNGTTAYFCGESTTMNQAFFGEFKINDLFPSGGVVRFYFCPWGANNIIRPTDLRRLKLFTDGGATCLAMVGESVFDPYNTYNNSTVVAAYPTTAGWGLVYYCNKDNAIHYTDVAVLDNVIVAVGNNLSGDSCYLKPFSRNSSFPLYPTTPGTMFRVRNEAGTGDVLAERWGPDCHSYLVGNALPTAIPLDPLMIDEGADTQSAIPVPLFLSVEKEHRTIFCHP